MSTPWEILASHQDASVNHLRATPDGGALEARFVQRVADYWICYLSSHTGCAHSCRFCHLTATRQTMMEPASLEDYLDQARAVIETYRKRAATGGQAKHMNYNFMSRGEALSNPTLLGQPAALFGGLRELADGVGMECQFLVSSILPREFNQSLASVLVDPAAIPYYSLYSLDPKFRKRWLPKALPGEAGLDLLAEYQRETEREVVLHWAFIAGENDASADIDRILEAVIQRQLRVRFNLVRYNPHDARHGVETAEAKLQELFAQLTGGLEQEGLLINGSRIVPRVGFDVKASCGMFVENPGHAASA